MICIIAFIVFSITGLFSASHRNLAKEAFDCVFRRVTLRPCNTGFDQKMKGLILGKLMNRSLFLTKIVNRYFEVFSWSLVIITLVSFVLVVQSLYFFYMYGSCNGLNQTGFCVFDPTGQNNKLTQIGPQGVCPVVEPSSKTIQIETLDLTQFPSINENAKESVIFFGCFGCEYSRKAYPLIKRLQERNEVNVTYVHFPSKDKTDYIPKVMHCAWKEDSTKFWSLNDALYTAPIEHLENKEEIDKLIIASDFNMTEIETCTGSSQTQAYINDLLKTYSETGIYGTPTVFIKDTVLVGPKPYAVYERILRRWW